MMSRLQSSRLKRRWQARGELSRVNPQVEALAKDVISGLSLEITQINSDFGQVRLATLGDILEETVPRIC